MRAVTANGGVAPQSSAVRRRRTVTPSAAYPWSVLAPQAWGRATGRGVTVAVIDTGIAGDLPDFRDADRRLARDRLGRDQPGRARRERPLRPRHARRGHHRRRRTRRRTDALAGRYVGVAPDANLVSIKIDDDQGNATVLDVIYGLQFAVDHKDEYGIRVVNLSLESTVAGSYKTDPLDAAVEAAWLHGIVVVAAAGNRGTTPTPSATPRATTRSRSPSARSTTTARADRRRPGRRRGRATAGRRTASPSPS